MLRAFVISALTAAATASDVDRTIGEALRGDDQCDAGDSDCSLHALQMKAAKGTQQSLPSECTAGLVGQVRQFGPTCIDNCPQICKPLGDAVTAFLTKTQDQSIEDAVKPVVCSNQESLGCAFEAGNLPHCQPLIDQAAALGFALPNSAADMATQCAASAVQTEALSAEAQQAQAASSHNSTVNSACTHGLVGKIRSYATSCFDSCQSICWPLELAIKAYLTKGGAPAVKPVVCGHKSAFACALSSSNQGKCMPLINKAASFGFKLPKSNSQLNGQCR